MTVMPLLYDILSPTELPQNQTMNPHTVSKHRLRIQNDQPIDTSHKTQHNFALIVSANQHAQNITISSLAISILLHIVEHASSDYKKRPRGNDGPPLNGLRGPRPGGLGPNKPASGSNGETGRMRGPNGCLGPPGDNGFGGSAPG